MAVLDRHSNPIEHQKADPNVFDPPAPNPRRLYAARICAFFGKLLRRKEVRLSAEAEQYLETHADIKGFHSTEGL